jgi:hypothetical protein
MNLFLYIQNKGFITCIECDVWKPELTGTTLPIYSSCFSALYRLAPQVAAWLACPLVRPWEEHSLKVFENRVHRRIFGSESNEVMGGWDKLYNEELDSLYSSTNIIMTMKSRRT